MMPNFAEIKAIVTSTAMIVFEITDDNLSTRSVLDTEEDLIHPGITASVSLRKIRPFTRIRTLQDGNLLIYSWL